MKDRQQKHLSQWYCQLW